LLTSWRIGRFAGWLARRSLVIVVASLALVHKRHVSDDIWCRDIV